MSSSPVVEAGDVPVMTREQAASMSEVHPNFHFTEQPSHDTTTRQEIATINTEHQHKQVSPSASPRVRVSLKGDHGSSEPESPASINHDAQANTQPGDSNSASASAKGSASDSHSIGPSASIPATTVNMTVNTHHGSISQAGPTSLSRRPFSFRDVTDINEDSQIRVQSARVHHDEYDKKRTCACCEKAPQQAQTPNKPEPDSKQPNTTDTNGKPASPDKTKTTNGTTPVPSSPKKASSGSWGLCGLCIGFRNCMIPEDPEYRCEHGRPCTAANHRHTKGC